MAVPSWLQELDAARLAGLMPDKRYLILSLGVDVAKGFPVIHVPPSYTPRHTDNLGALAALDVEIAFSENERFGRLQALCAGILAVEPRRLLLMAVSPAAALILMKKEVTWH